MDLQCFLYNLKGIKFADNSWVTELSNKNVTWATDNNEIWLNGEPSNNDEDEHSLCAQFMDGKLDDSVSIDYA